MDVATLESHLQTYFDQQAQAFGLEQDTIQVRYILNWGGFVNYAFKVTDGRRSYHLKLVDKTEDQADLRQWQSLRTILERRYHAPQMLDWVVIPKTGFEGLLFAWVDGRKPELKKSPGLVKEVVTVAAQLHADDELADKLSQNHPKLDCLHTFLDTYIERFDGDLEIISPTPLPFVSEETLTWMFEEVRHLENLARNSAAFAEPGGAPIHGDLQADNLLVTEGDNWFLLDWDDLTLGDPILDFTTLLAPPLSEWQDNAWPDFPLPHATQAGFAERMDLYLRARLLDWVIDVLADYIEAEVAPEQRDRVQTEKKRQHLQALALYQSRYG